MGFAMGIFIVTTNNIFFKIELIYSLCGEVWIILFKQKGSSGI